MTCVECGAAVPGPALFCAACLQAGVTHNEQRIAAESKRLNDPARRRAAVIGLEVWS